MGERYTYRAGVGFVKGKAAPKQLDEELRKLPSDSVTDDIDDPDRVHQDDAEHVRESIIYDKEQAEKKAEAPTSPQEEVDKLPAVKPHEYVLLRDLGFERRQWEIDVIRMRIMKALLATACSEIEANKPVDLEAVHHVWFAPPGEVNAYQLREGNPPPKSERPWWLHNIELHVVLNEVPNTVRHALTERGHSFDALDKAVAARKREAEQVRQEFLL